MLSICEFHDIERFPGLRSEWDHLWAETPGARFAQTWEWLEAYAGHRKSGEQLRVFSVVMRDRPIGFLPLVVKPVKTPWGMLRVLGSPSHEVDPGCGPVGRTRAATWMAVMRHLKESRRDWDVIDLCSRDAGDPTRSRLANAMRLAGFRTHPRPGGWSAEIDLSDGWEAYWRDRGADLHERCCRGTRTLEPNGDIVFERVRPLGSAFGDRDPAWARLAAVDAVLGRRRRTGCERETHVRAAARGAVDMSLLSVGGRPVAASYGYSRDGVVESLRLGIARGMPVEVADALLYRLLRDGVRRGDRVYRVAAEDFEQTAGWRTSANRAWWHTHYAATAPRAQLWRLGRWLSAGSNATPADPVEEATGKVAPVAGPVRRQYGRLAVVGG